MKKGFVLVDVPDNCKECPLLDNLYNSIGEECAYCNVAPGGVNGCRIEEEIYEKPDWCPIKPCYSSEDGDTSLIEGEKESVVLSPKELIELLRKAPQDDILMVEINNGNDESGVIEDVLIGGGTIRGFTFIKVSTNI